MTDSRGHIPEGPWAFDENVTAVFDDMLERSIPQYAEMRRLTSNLAARYAREHTAIVDLGCSRGGALADAIVAVDARRIEGVRYIGAEVSPPMLAAARKRFAKTPTSVTIVEHDLRGGMPPEGGNPSVVLSVLTLQFTPIEYRQQIVESIFERLRPGGAFIFVEKVLGSTATIDATMVDAYYDGKRASGYSDEEIARKRHSLEGVLVPVTARWNEELLRSAGFSDVDCFWRSLNFAGWLAVRRR